MLNNCQFIGNLGQDPELRHMPSGESVVNLSIACSEKWKNKETGQPQEHTEWVRVSYFGKIADLAAQYLAKGSKVYVQGKLATRKYQAADGTDRYSTEIKGRELKFLDSKKDSQRQQDAPQQAAPQPDNRAPAHDFDDDIPF